MILVVGAHSRKVGKTSLGCAVIRATPAFAWTAVKISAHRDGSSGRAEWLLERAPGEGDTGRYLRAGALSAWRLRATDDELPGAVGRLRSIIDSSRNVLIESNRVVEHVRPDLYVAALDLAVEDFKESASRNLDAVDAFVVVERGGPAASWVDAVAARVGGRAVHRATPDDYAPRELIRRIAALAARPTGASAAFVGLRGLASCLLPSSS